MKLPPSGKPGTQRAITQGAKPMTVDFSKLLQRPADDIKRPPAWPQGTYEGLIAKYEFGESAQKKTPYVRFFANIVAAGNDVDKDELAENEIKLDSRQFWEDFYITDAALWRLKEFLESLGVPSEGRLLDEMIPDAMNQPVLVSLDKQMRDDPKEPPYNITTGFTGKANAA